MAPAASSGPLLSDFDERLGGNAKPFMQPPDHFERKRAPAIKYLVHPVAAADEGNEVAWLKPILVHMILNCLNRGPEDRTDNASAPRLQPM